MACPLAEELATAITEDDVAGAYEQLISLDWLAHAQDDSVRDLFQLLNDHVAAGQPVNQRVLAGALRELVRRVYSGGSRRWRQLTDDSCAAAVELYRRLGASIAPRYLLLQLLAGSRRPEDLAQFAELIVADPPTEMTAASLVFGPLFQHRDYDPQPLFPRLLDGLLHPAVAPAIVDLANFVTREQLVDTHPGAGRQEQLAALLGELVQRLGLLEERPGDVSADERQLAAVVVGSISLAVSLCDALALVGDRCAVGKLYQALQLRHRRLRTEAAGALARLGEDRGREVLVSLAAEPVARLRVLAYAAELGIEDQLDARFTTATAQAESELALWLSQPTQLGFPPSRLELVDSRTLYWPGYDEPVDCFLFRFFYEVGAGEYSNIGIAGPVCHAFGADLADLLPDDIYAVFAGWQVDHEDIYELDANHLSVPQRLEMVRLERRLHDDGFAAIEPITLGMFFGERVLVARASRQGLAGIVVIGSDEPYWHPTAGRPRPLGPHEAYCLFKGRKLLRTFNT